LNASPRRGRSAAPRRCLHAPSLVALAAFALCCALLALVHGLPPRTGLFYGAASALCFALYAADKAAAIRGRRRVSETTLLALGALGGWPGAIVAQQALRHKSAKPAFRVRFWISVVVNVGAFVALALLLPAGRAA